MPIWLEIVLVLALILANGVFATSEIAVVTARRGRLRRRAEQGKAGATAALELAKEPTDFLSTIQIGITLVGILVGAVGGASFAGPLAERLAGVPVLGAHARPLAYVVVIALTTYLTLVFGELVTSARWWPRPRGTAPWGADSATLRQRLERAAHTRLLACDGSLDRLVGVVHAREALQQCLRDRLDLRAIAAEPLTASADMRLLRAVELLRGSGNELLVVQDADDRVRGLVTMADIVANLMADLPRHGGEAGDEIQLRDDGSLLADGRAPLERVVEILGADPPAIEVRGGERTVAELLRDRLEAPPRVGDVLERWGLRFEIVDLDGPRIDRVLVSRPEDPERE